MAKQNKKELPKQTVTTSLLPHLVYDGKQNKKELPKQTVTTSLLRNLVHYGKTK